MATPVYHKWFTLPENGAACSQGDGIPELEPAACRGMLGVWRLFTETSCGGVVAARTFIYNQYAQQLTDSVTVGTSAYPVAEAYDTNGQLSTCSILHGDEQKTFTYNRLSGTHLLAALGLPTNRTIQQQGATRNDTFTHNDRSERTAATVGASNYAYDYDNIGNRKTAQETSDNFGYEANALNQHTQITENETPFVPEFDLDGNQTRIKTTTGIWTATYNALNRPVRFENVAAGIVITADYDYMGRRVFKKVETAGNITSHLH